MPAIRPPSAAGDARPPDGGVHNYAPQDLLQAVRFLFEQTDMYPLASLVDAWLPLESANEAFRLSRDPDRIRVGVMPLD